MNLVTKRRAAAFCAVCGRKDAPRWQGTSLRLSFHYAPAPCGLPCEGGPISHEERTYHRSAHSAGCHCGQGAAARVSA